MAECIDCGVQLALLNSMPNGRCKKCHAKFLLESNDLRVPTNNLRPHEKRNEITKVLLTTETAPNLNITKRIEIVTAECAFGMNMFKDLFAGVRNIVGGRSEAVQQTMRDSRRTALYELKKEAFQVGANAVVGVDLDYVELSSNGSMVMLVASGTAVIIEENVDE